jgi:hypothetical protein
MIEMI